jgi:hypothetical protein
VPVEQVASAHTPTLIPEPEPGLEAGALAVPLVLTPVLALPVPVLVLGLEQVARAHRPTLMPEPDPDPVPVLVLPVALPAPPVALVLPVPHVPVPPGPLVAAVSVAVMAGGGAVDGGDWAAWAGVWLSRNIPLAPAAMIRPR